MAKYKQISIPTDQEIQVHLDSLNHTQNTAPVSPETEAARTKGINNYKKWFKERGLLIRMERGKWNLVEVLDDIGVKQEK